MDHLGERLSALIDGELGAAEHERALIHLAKCEPCRFEADMMRRLKRRLTGLGEPEPDLDFMGRLMARPGMDGPFGSSPPLGSSRPLGGFPGEPPRNLPEEPTRKAPERREPRTSPERYVPVRRPEDGGSVRSPYFSGGRYAVAGLAVATALLGSAFVAGGENPDNAPVVEPRLSDYAVEHAVTSRQIPVVDPTTDPVVAWPAGIPRTSERTSDPNETTR